MTNLGYFPLRQLPKDKWKGTGLSRKEREAIDAVAAKFRRSEAHRGDARIEMNELLSDLILIRTGRHPLTNCSLGNGFVPRISDIAVKGTCRFVLDEKYKSPILTNPSWLDIAIVTDDALYKTHPPLDEYYVLHGFQFLGNRDGVQMYELCTWSCYAD